MTDTIGTDRAKLLDVRKLPPNRSMFAQPPTVRRAQSSAWLLAIVAACSSTQEKVGTDQAPLNTLYVATYGNSLPEQSSDALGTTSTVMKNGNDAICGAELVTLSAWEQLAAPASDHPSGIFLGRGCGVNPLTITNNGTQVTAAMTGTPPEWTNQFGSRPMVWVGEPHLLPLKHDASWVALVGGVGKTNPLGGATTYAIAVVLSTDGGITWVPNSIHLVDNANSGLQPDVKDIDASSASINDYDTGDNFINPAPNLRDFFVTWASHGQRWIRTMAYNASDQAWRKDPPASLPAASPGDAFYPNGAGDTCGSQGCELTDMSVTSGVSTSGRSFTFVEWPSQQPLYTASPQCDVNNSGSTIANQVWHAALGFYGQGWQRLPDSPHPVSGAWPKCVGGLPGSMPGFRNLRRSSLAFDPATHTVIDAVAVPSSSGVAGTYIEASAYPILLNGPSPPPYVVYSSNPLRGDRGIRHDQWMPVVATDGVGAASIDWVDSADDPGGSFLPNLPFGLYGATTLQLVSPPGQTSWNQARIFPIAGPGVPLGDPTLYLFDDLGRHNSIGSLPGIFSTTFSGDSKSHIMHSGVFIGP